MSREQSLIQRNRELTKLLSKANVELKLLIMHSTHGKIEPEYLQIAKDLTEVINQSLNIIEA